MSFLTAIKRPGAEIYWLARYTFGGATGATGAWATRAVAKTTEYLEGRILSLGSINYGLPESPGALPERWTASLVLDASDTVLQPWVLGTASASPSTEYEDDGFHNLRVTLYHCVKDTDGTFYEQQATPELVCVACKPIGGTKLALGLASREDGALGLSGFTATVRQLAEGQGKTDGTKAYFDGSTATFTWSGDFVDWQQVMLGGDALDDTVPSAYGRALVPFLRLTKPSNTDFGLLFIRHGDRSAPDLTDVEQWKWFKERFEQELPADGFDRPASYLWSCEVTIDDENGDPLDVWVVGAALSISPDIEMELGLDGTRTDHNAGGVAGTAPVFVLPALLNDLSARNASGPTTPVRLFKEIVTDHAEDGAAAIDSTYFDRAGHEGGGLTVGGLVRGNGSIAEWSVHIFEPWGISLALTRGGKLAPFAPGRWGAADVSAAAGTLPHLMDSDVFEADYEEPIPLSPAEAGAAVTKVSLDWTEEQRKFWPRHMLKARAPGAMAIPLGGEVEGQASAAWLVPGRSDRALAHLAERRNFITRRIRLATHVWVATSYWIGDLFRLTYALGSGGDDGFGGFA